MRKVYNCLRCKKWFKEAKIVEFEQFGGVELCPFCEGRVHRTRGIKAALLLLWWRLKELFLSGGSGRPTARW